MNREDQCPELRRRICPFISSGQDMVYCKGTGCNACKPILTDDGKIWVCALIDRDFADTWEVADGVFM